MQHFEGIKIPVSQQKQTAYNNRNNRKLENSPNKSTHEKGNTSASKNHKALVMKYIISFSVSFHELPSLLVFSPF